MKICSMIAFAVLLCVVSGCLAHNGGDCEFDSLTTEDWRIGKRWYPKLQNETFSYTVSYSGKIDILEKSCSFSTLEKSDKGLILNSSPNLKELDLMIPPSPWFEARCKLTLSCRKGSSRLELIQPIIDVNNYVPVFHNDSYEILVPSYIPANTDLTKYLDNPIQVEDLDFSNYNMSFEIEPKHFRVSTRLIEDMYRRIYVPVIENKHSMNMTEDLTYFLSATDTGNIPHSLSSTIRITLRKISSEDNNHCLYFAKKLYTLTYETLRDSVALFINEDIHLVTKGHEEDIFIYFSDNLQIEAYFNATYNGESGKVTVSLVKPLPPNIQKENSSIRLTICAKSSNCLIESCSVLQINLQVSSALT